jgi:organic radical activating enzyme
MVQMKMDYPLKVTNKCNWHCDYCVTNIHQEPEIKYKKVLEEAKTIPEGSKVSFGFGEPGMLPRRHLLELIEVCKQRNCKLVLLTNGLVFKKNPDLVEQFDFVRYHCVEYLTDDIEFPDLDQSRVDYNIVVTEETVKNGQALEFINKYPHIKFLVSPDCRRTRVMNLPLFMRFYNEHKERLHPETLERFVICKTFDL